MDGTPQKSVSHALLVQLTKRMGNAQLVCLHDSLIQRTLVSQHCSQCLKKHLIRG